MGLDGFSMANLGLYNKLTSAQMANEVDLMVARGSANQIKDIDAMGKRQGILRKENDFEETGGQAFLGGQSGEGEEEDTEVLAAPEVELDDDDPEHSPKRFEMKINNEANIVELYDNYLQMTVQRLTTKDMLSMVKKFDDPAGVLVNRKI